MAAGEGEQQHPLGIYFQIWGYLFILSTGSYFSDFLPDGALRWGLILIFMVLKAGLIVAVFMHMLWERISLLYAILVPPLALMVLVAIMVVESDYTFWTRVIYTGDEEPVAAEHGPEPAAEEHN